MQGDSRNDVITLDIPEPLYDRVLLRQQEAKKNEGLIVIPDEFQERQAVGTVVAVGPGQLLEGGGYQAPLVRQGDTVLFARYAGSTIELPNGEVLVSMPERDIHCILEKAVR